MNLMDRQALAAQNLTDSPHHVSQPKKLSHNKKKEFANTRTRNPTHMLTNKDLQYTMLQTPPLSQLTRQSIDRALYAGIVIF